MSDQPTAAAPVSRAEVRKVALGTVPGFIAFGFGSGLAPLAPGTAGTLAAVPLAVPFLALQPGVFWVVWIASFCYGIHACTVSSRRLGVHDHGGIVWDEMVAYWLILAFVPQRWEWWLAAFVLFRIFDILKPWPIRQLDQAMKGGLGIMLDDIMAAVYALVLLIPATRLLAN